MKVDVLSRSTVVSTCDEHRVNSSVQNEDSVVRSLQLCSVCRRFGILYAQSLEAFRFDWDFDPILQFCSTSQCWAVAVAHLKICKNWKLLSTQTFCQFDYIIILNQEVIRILS